LETKSAGEDWGVEEIAAVMRVRRLQWLGHVERRDDGSWLKRIRSLDCGGRRPRGRPRTTWRSVVEQDLRNCGIRLDETADREGWRRRVKAAVREG